MTGLATGEPDRSLTPNRSSTVRIGASGPIPTILVLLALGFALRAIIAYALPGSGFANDLAAFRAWADLLAKNGLAGFYARPEFHDYTPGYMLYLWVLGLIHQAIPTLDLVKIPAMLSDLAIGWLIWSMIRELGASERLALAGAALYLFVPITWFDSVVWGQVDSVGVVFMLLGVRALWQNRPELAAVWAVVAPVVKPQLGILAFIAAAVLLRRHLWDPLVAGAASAPIEAQHGDRDGRDEPRRRGPIDRALGRGPIRLLTSGGVGLVTMSALTLPFGIWIPGLIGQVQTAFGGYPYITVNAYNPWALIDRAGDGLASSGQWLCDAVTANPSICPAGSQVQIGPLPAVAVGTILLFLAILVVMAIVASRPDPITILIGLAVLSVAFFILPTRVHERYLFPFFGLGAILAAVSGRWRWGYAILGLATFLNMYVVLTTLYPGNPQISDWLGIGPLIRSQPGVTFVVALHTIGFGWVAWQLRRAGTRAVERDLETAVAAADGPPGFRSAPAGRPAPAGAAMTAVRKPVAGSWIPGGVGAGGAGAVGAAPALAVDRDWPAVDPDRELGWLGWLGPIRRVLAARPLRADRSRALHDEPTGRFDRLDVWLLVVLVVAALGLRMWRLDEPASMHFDEVYHARTATEFLQDWRYGIPHSIYEYTHPHLAKYAMALGIVAWGNDRVTSTSDLGVPVRDAVVEPRWDDPTMPDHRAGDRLYVATGSEVRVYDLITRGLLAALPVAGASTVAIDPSTHRLLVGTDSGTIASVDTAAEFDALRIGGDPAQIEPPAPFGAVGAAVERLLATTDGSYVVAITAGDEVVSLDGGTGELLGRAKLAKAADLAPAGTGEALVARPADVTAAKDEAATLARLLGGNAATYEAKLGTSADRVVIAGSVDSGAQKSVEAAITEGTLEGLAFEELPLIGVADARGLTVVDPATMATTDEVPISGGATGLSATSNLDAPRLYVASGKSVVVVKLAQNAQEATPPAVETTIKMPGPVSRVTFDAAAVMVHVLGQTPDGSASTIYAIEPHAQSVYADARLPFTPVAWATDVAADFPSADRQQIMTLSDSGGVAAVDVGHHEFSWRMPGVLAGALTAGLLYLLGRLLFRRRSIGVLAAIFSLADGMMFVQSRIAMNDVYVGLFLMAAYLLFAVVWLGVWRWRGAFWVSMPIIGLLLGLALASKWVAAYAMAAMVLLILVRSALGRVLTIIGLILATAILGYQGIVVAPDATSSSGNVLFLLLMIGLTLIATVVTVTHPIAWSPEEVRLAVGAPAGLGIVLGLVAIPLASSGAKVSVGPITGLPQVLLSTGLLLLFVAGGIAILFGLAGRWGIGPLAGPRAADDPTPPAAPAPTGWLRPGWAYGIPIAWAGLSLMVIPIVVYVISYIPWALNSGGSAGSPQIFPAETPIIGNWPPGHNGQTLLDLTGAMYRYHNELRATHAAASPWWAWPLDLKPVWFYQGSFAGDTSAAIYDAGNLVIWWLGVPAMAFIVWQAYRRRSLGLALITIAFAFQWLSWSRIDRATFQYHYYTSVPFIILALAYFLAELWHGASFRTWVLARVAAAVAIMGPGLLWLFKTPLCGFVGVDRAYANSPACHGNPGDFVLTVRSAGLVLVVGIGVIVLIYQLTHLEDRRPGGRPPPERSGWLSNGMARLLVSAGVAIAAVVLVSAVAGDRVLVSVQSFSILPLAAILVGFLGFVGWFVLSARDARRFVAGAVFAAIGTFLVVYPNISALPLPSTVFNAYQGLLPTYLYPFQFPVNTDAPANVPGLFQPDKAMFGLPGVPVLAVFLAITCVIVGYAAWSWRQAAGDRDWDRAEDGSQRSTP